MQIAVFDLKIAFYAREVLVCRFVEGFFAGVTKSEEGDSLTPSISGRAVGVGNYGVCPGRRKNIVTLP